MYDLVGVGDTAMDVFLMLHEATVSCQLNAQTCQLCVNYSDKIPVKQVVDVPGVGTAPNCIVGASRFGLKTGLYTILGDDVAGKQSLAVFKKEKVSPTLVKIDKTTRTDYSSVISFKGERTILTYQAPRKYKLPIFETNWLFLASLSEGHKILHREIIRKIKTEKIKLAFNPGANELRDGVESLKTILSVTEVLFLNKEEVWQLLGKIEDIKFMLRRLMELGPRIVVITDGSNGAYCFDGMNVYFQGIFDVPVLEKTGAGDAFACGFLAALANGLNVKQALRWGSANSAAVVQKIGGQAGLLNKKELLKFLKNSPESQAKII